MFFTDHYCQHYFALGISTSLPTFEIEALVADIRGQVPFATLAAHSVLASPCALVLGLLLLSPPEWLKLLRVLSVLSFLRIT